MAYLNSSCPWGRLGGAILIIAGTSIGAGVLALPTMGAQVGSGYAYGYLLIAWCIMTYCALLLLEVNLALPMGNHFTTMAKATLGRYVQWLTVLVYLMMLYALLASYLAGGGEMLQVILLQIGLDVGYNVAALLFVLLFCGLILGPIRYIDYSNRFFMISKWLVFVWIFLLLRHYSTWPPVGWAAYQPISGTVFMVFIASFGFSVVLPSLRSYLGGQVRWLRMAIILGSSVPLLLYVLWHTLLALTIDNDLQVAQLAYTGQPIATLGDQLGILTHEPEMTSYFYALASICLITSFIGVALSMRDFIVDGLNNVLPRLNRLLLGICIFGPPLLSIWWFNNIFIQALQYAGIGVLLLHIILPIAMVWALRLRHSPHAYRVKGFKSFSVLIILGCIWLLTTM